MVKIVELLAPAKDRISLSSAIKNGANSVYVGLDGYNMRANIANFSMEEISEAAALCHQRGVKLYVCINTSLSEVEVEKLKVNMPKLKDCGVDAVIVSDLGAVKIARDSEMEVHMSVQVNITNSESLKVLKKLGVNRIILSRELPIQTIQEIAVNSPMELEVFVHGAMCVAVSGRCFLSSYLYNKSANCGECLQPCRKEWKIISEDDEEFILGENNFSNTGNTTETRVTTHILSPRDLCMIEHIPLLIESGVKVFKIEGRARPADYVATVTRVYREAINEYEAGLWNTPEHEENIRRWLEELKNVFNRGFDTGFYFNTPKENSSSNKAKYKKKDIGEVVNYYKRVQAAEIRLWDDINVGDFLVIQGQTTGSIEQTVESMQIDGKPVKNGTKGQNVAVHVTDIVRPGDNVYKRIFKN
ncbi:MAG: U32 family peptidase [Methanobacterium sp. ERen5]|nr:MAG: U32 family peptidase [Methanobacterium sp. ERen5]